MTDHEDLKKLVSSFQKIQKRNPPDSLEWIKASKQINAIAKLLAATKK